MRVELLLLIAGMAAVTYLTRVSFLILAGRVKMAEPLSAGLKFIPVGILTAFIIPGLLAPQGRVDLSWDNHYLLAGLASGLVALRWKNVFLAMGSGMVVILLLRFLFNRP